MNGRPPDTAVPGSSAGTVVCRAMVGLLIALVPGGARGGAPSDAAAPRVWNVFLFAGQSNMAGADSEVTDPNGFQETEADRATRFTAAPLPGGERSSQYVAWGTIRGHTVKDRLVHGPEVGFARALHAAGRRDVAIIKVYANFGRDATRWPWSEGEPLYEAWRRFASSRIEELQAGGDRVRVVGFVWHQGIDDAIQGAFADDYEPRLKRLIASLRREFADGTAPFVLARSVFSRIAQPEEDPTGASPMFRVRAAQVRIGRTYPFTRWIDVDDLPNVNTHHFTAEGQLAIGGRFAKEWLALRDEADAPVAIGTRRELFVDGALIATLSGARRTLHAPVARDTVIVHDAPWEGAGSGYHSVFRDGERILLYYRGSELGVRNGRLILGDERTCVAESQDGFTFTKPELGLHAHGDSRANNIIWASAGTHNFSPFVDTRPDCPRESRFKAVGGLPTDGGLFAFQSADGIHWAHARDEPIIREGAFDSQNVAFWDASASVYRVYYRTFTEGVTTRDEWNPAGFRAIRTAVSRDFLQWDPPSDLTYGDSPAEHLYTNQVMPYPRAPHLLLGFPTRYVERGWSDSMRALPQREQREERAAAHLRYGTAITETLIMASRDGVHFDRWNEAFLRPGPERPDTWLYGHQYMARGLIETRSALSGAPSELSLYATEGSWHEPANRLRRYSLRMDGFVSVNAPWDGGELTTRPLTFSGIRLSLNFATSAAGDIRVEIQDAGGTPIPGFTLDACEPLFGDSIDRTVTWGSDNPETRGDLGSLRDRPVRLRFVLRDADLYAFRFPESNR